MLVFWLVASLLWHSSRTTDMFHALAIHILRHSGDDRPALESAVRPCRSQTCDHDWSAGTVTFHVLLRFIQNLLGSGPQVCTTLPLLASAPAFISVSDDPRLFHIVEA